MKSTKISHFKQTNTAAALAISIAAGTASAQTFDFKGTFNHYDPDGINQFTDTGVTGFLNMGGLPIGSMTSPNNFQGFTWVADVDNVFQYDFTTGGTQSFSWMWDLRVYRHKTDPFAPDVRCKVGDTVNGCTDANLSIDPAFDTTLANYNLLGTIPDAGGYTFTMDGTPGGGMMAMGAFFDWNTSPDIGTLVVMDITGGDFTGPTTVVTIDSNGDGVPGEPMNNGPFTGHTAAFDGTLTPTACSYTVLPPANITDKAVSGTSMVTINIGNATVTDINTGDTFPASALLLPNTPLVPDSDVTFSTGVSSIEWDKANTTEQDCESTQVVVVHEWNPPADVTVTASTPATGINLGVPTDLGGQLNPNGVPLVFDNDAPAAGFGAGTTVVTWTATDDFGGTTTATQNVTVNLPAGIIGADCVIDLDTVGDRLVDGRFTMRNPTGAITGTLDDTVTGEIDTSIICTDESCAMSGARLETTQPFFGELWQANTIRLFEEGTWTFESCLPDGSTQCSPPTPISMTVNSGQLGAHMLFDWSVNKSIDVVVVWDVGCGEFQLTTTDPDGDGIIGSPMVDGPFIGFNAAFDLNTLAGQPPIADGGFEVSIPVYKNPVAGGSPIPLDHNMLSSNDLPADASAVRSCVGGCFEFVTDGVMSDADNIGPFKYVQVVIPLTEKTPYYSVVRKYNAGNGTWGPFVINGRNDAKSAPLTGAGMCPEPGDSAYDRPETSALKDKLRADDECLELTIEDNGPNDMDATLDIVRDPGGVAEVTPTQLPDPSTSGGGCSVSSNKAAAVNAGHWWLLAGFIGWLGWHRRKGMQC